MIRAGSFQLRISYDSVKHAMFCDHTLNVKRIAPSSLRSQHSNHTHSSSTKYAEFKTFFPLLQRVPMLHFL